jgi:hypothetical protein
MTNLDLFIFSGQGVYQEAIDRKAKRKASFAKTKTSYCDQKLKNDLRIPTIRQNGYFYYVYSYYRLEPIHLQKLCLPLWLH